MQTTFCPYCLKMVQTDICPYCGNDVNYTGNPLQLPVGYTLNGQHPYILGAALGQGGFGITYIALDGMTGNRVAIKEYFPTHCSGRNNDTMVQSYLGQEEIFHKGREQFLLEAQTLQNLSDLKSIVDILDYFEANNTAYLVMEYLEGCSLKDYVEQRGRIPAQQFLLQLWPLLEDIETMHQRGVIHRDIAPDNIMLLPDGTMKLIDFGAARSYLGDKSMTVVVKKGFAPVEQYMRKGSGACTDVYALAATIYYCVTGTVPPDSAERQYGDEELQPPTALGAELMPRQEQALLDALEIQPKARTQSILQLAQGLTAEQQDAHREEPRQKPQPPETVFQAEPNTVQENCPIMVTGLKLVRNYEQHTLIASGQFRNLSEWSFRSVFLDLQCRDAEGHAKDDVLHCEISCENVGPNGTFGTGTQIILPDWDTASIAAVVRKILCTDGRELECGTCQEVVCPPEPLSVKLGSDPALDEEYKRQVGWSASNIPVSAAYHWRCCCGQVNLSGASTCISCKAEKEPQFRWLDPVLLAGTIAKRKEEEERIAREAARKRAEELRIRKEKAKKIIKRTGIAVACAAGVTVAAVGIRLGVSVKRYSDARKLMEKADYSAAYDIYLKLGDFKDSQELANTAMYTKGMAHMEQEQYQEASEAFAAVADYRDSEEKAVYCRNRAAYRDAESLLDAARYQEAAAAFEKIRSFEDSADRAKEATYRYAETLLDATRYLDAAAVFEALDSFEDSADRAKEATYLYAETLLDATEYLEAASVFETLATFGDSPERASQAKYIYAGIMAEEQQYEKAIELYQELDSFKDSAQLAKKVNYDYATVLAEQGKLHEAYLQYSKELNYEDSERRAHEAEYTYGCSLLEAEKYDQAAEAFARTGNYKDSKTKYSEAKYCRGVQLMSFSKWTDASKIFGELKNYKDSATQYKTARYEYGCELMDHKAYDTAVTVLEELGSYKDSAAKVKEAKYQYCQSHKYKSDKKTFEYLKELKKLNYQDSKSLYNSLFAWSVTMTAVNTDRNDYTTKSYSVSRYNNYLHFQFKLSGGGPNERVKLVAKTRYPDGSTYTSNWYWEDKYDGCGFGIEWSEGIYKRPERGSVGTFTVMVYIAGTNECIGEGSVQITSS